MRYRDIIEHATLAPDFTRWFAGSKVIDAAGRPLRCYHGTFSQFDTFLIGSHFGDEEAANARIRNRQKGWSHDEDKPREIEPRGHVYPVYLSIKNPLRIVDDGGLGDGYDLTIACVAAGAITEVDRQDARLELGAFASGASWCRWLFKQLSAQGYDGLVYRNTVEGNADSWVNFRQDQVRPALTY